MRNHGKRYLARLIMEFRFIAPLALVIVILTNFLADKGDFVRAKEQIMLNNSDQALNYVVTKLLDNNQFTEIKLLSGEQYIHQAEQQPLLIQQKIINWQNVSIDKPNYRDANIKLAILNWEIYRVFDAKKYLESALKIDPNNEIAKKLTILFR